jgi:hypothetical protein
LKTIKLEVYVVSALPPKADIDRRGGHVRLVPILLQKSVASFFGG